MLSMGIALTHIEFAGRDFRFVRNLCSMLSRPGLPSLQVNDTSRFVCAQICTTIYDKFCNGFFYNRIQVTILLFYTIQAA